MSINPAALEQLGKEEPLRLTELRKLPSFINYRYLDLPTPIRLQFGKRSLRVTALSDKSDPEIRFEVFERLNKGGVSLSPQEVRACIYRGPFAELLRELGEQPTFKKLVKLQPIHQNDGTREELVLKFFAYLNWADQYDGNVKSLLNRYMKESGPQLDLDQCRKLFDNVIDAIFEINKGPLLRKGYGNTPINQLEAVLVGAGRILKAGKKLKTPPTDWLNDADLLKSSTKGTNTKSSFEARNARAEKLLGG